MHTLRSAAPLAALLGLTALAAPAALAGTYVTTTADKPFNTDPATNTPYLNQGFYYSYGFHEPTNNNHATGGNTSGDGPGGVGTTDKRSFYTFDLSGLNLTGQVVTGATLTLVPFQENGTIVEGRAVYLRATHADSGPVRRDHPRPDTKFQNDRHVHFCRPGQWRFLRFFRCTAGTDHGHEPGA